MRAKLCIPGLALLATLSMLTSNSSFAAEGESDKGGKGHGDRPSKEEIFKHIDTNGDGKISLEEFEAHKPPHDPPAGAPSKEEIFKKMDTDGDGFLTLEEFKLPPPPAGKKGGGKDGAHKPAGDGSAKSKN